MEYVRESFYPVVIWSPREGDILSRCDIVNWLPVSLRSSAKCCLTQLWEGQCRKLRPRLIIVTERKCYELFSNVTLVTQLDLPYRVSSNCSSTSQWACDSSFWCSFCIQWWCICCTNEEIRVKPCHEQLLVNWFTLVCSIQSRYLCLLPSSYCPIYTQWLPVHAN